MGKHEQAEQNAATAAAPDELEAEAAEAPEHGAATAGEEVGSEQTEAEVDSELLDLQFALVEAEKELAEHRDAMLRMQAEMENLRKRLVRDLERSRRLALERMMSDLLPVRDSLERGLDAAGEAASVESLLEGKALILRMLGKVMEDHGLQLIDPLGEPFNPERHEAMSMLPSDEYAEDIVMEVLQKGFQLHDRLIRPARVVVSRGPAAD